MQPIFEHYLAQTVRAKLEGKQQNDEVANYVELFHSDVAKPPSCKSTFEARYPSRMVLDRIERLLLEENFHLGRGPDFLRGYLKGSMTKQFSAKPLWLGAVSSGRRDWQLKVHITVTISPDKSVTMHMAPPLEMWVEDFQRTLLDQLASIPQSEIERERIAQSALKNISTGDKILSPGETLAGPYNGSLRDYSKCATQTEVLDLRAGRGGVLPLGRWAYIPSDQNSQLGEHLFLSPLMTPGLPDGTLREHQGAIICAPQNSGKTELLLQWASAANAKGYNLLIIDVKGNLLSKLQRQSWRGDLFHLTTDPQHSPSRDTGVPNHALNLLEGIDPRSPLALQRVRQISEALLPSEGLDKGETRVWRSTWLNWLTAFIHLNLLVQYYLPSDERHVDLSNVHDLASEEDVLVDIIQMLDALEKEQLELGKPLVDPGLETWFSDIAVLLPEAVIVPADERWGRSELRGARAQYSFRWLTENVAGALRPFRRHGLLYEKVSGQYGLPRFSLERLAGLDDSLNPSSRQITVVLAMREQELDDAQTLLTVAVVKLQQSLYERMRFAGTGKLHPMLMLLDETRRIRNFKPHEYVSYAREAEAGCVVVYQSLDQIGDPGQIRELLSNIGTQVYLGSLTDTTAQYFISTLGTRGRNVFSITAGGRDGPMLQISNQEIPFFSTGDLRILPAGRYPALVYLREQPARSPILITLDRELLKCP